MNYNLFVAGTEASTDALLFEFPSEIYRPWRENYVVKTAHKKTEGIANRARSKVMGPRSVPRIIDNATISTNLGSLDASSAFSWYDLLTCNGL